MDSKIRNIIKDGVEFTSRLEFRESLVLAREYYEELTGPVPSDRIEFEQKMTCFYEWFLFHYQGQHLKAPLIHRYLFEHKIEEDLAKALINVNYSIFQFSQGFPLRGVYLKDFVADQKIKLGKDHKSFGLVDGDLFVGRSITCGETSYLLDGICPLPKQLRPILMKKLKRVRKSYNSLNRQEFLLKLEKIHNKWFYYQGKVSLEDVFNSVFTVQEKVIGNHL